MYLVGCQALQLPSCALIGFFKGILLFFLNFFNFCSHGLEKVISFMYESPKIMKNLTLLLFFVTTCNFLSIDGSEQSFSDLRYKIENYDVDGVACSMKWGMINPNLMSYGYQCSLLTMAIRKYNQTENELNKKNKLM